MKMAKKRAVSLVIALLLTVVSAVTPVIISSADNSSALMEEAAKTVKTKISSMVFKNDTSDSEIVSFAADSLDSGYTVTKVGEFKKEAAVNGAEVTLDGEKIAATRTADGKISGTLMLRNDKGAEISVSFSEAIKADAAQKSFDYTSADLVPASDIKVEGGTVKSAVTDGKKLLIIDGEKLNAATVADDAFATSSATKLADTVETAIFRNISYTKNLVRFSNVRVVIFDGGVTQTAGKSPYSNEIANNFAKLKNLEYISLNEGLKYIGFADFDGTAGSFGIVVPDSVIRFGGWTMSGASGLYAIKLTENTVSGNYLSDGGIFNGCSSLISVKLPEGIASLSNQDFTNCAKLETVQLPSTLTAIGGSATFNGCTALKILILPSALKTLNKEISRTSLKLVVTGDSIDDGTAGIIKKYADSGNTVICFGGSKAAKTLGAGKYTDIAEFYNGLGNSELVSEYNAADSTVKITVNMESGYPLPEGGLYFAYRDTVNSVAAPAPEVNSVKNEYTYTLGSICGGLELKAVKVYSEAEAEAYRALAQSALDKLAVSRNTTADDLLNCVKKAVNDENIDFVWIDEFKKVTPIDSAEIYLDGKLIESTDRADGKISATIGLVAGDETAILFTEKTLAANTERISYTAADKAPDSAFILDNRKLVGYKGNYKLVIIPDYVDRIEIKSPFRADIHSTFGHGACNCLSSIETVIAHNKISYMDWNTFAELKNLKAAVVNGADSSGLSGQNFMSCTSLKYVKLGSNVLKIGQSAFDGCTSLNALKLPEKLTEIGAIAFKNSGIKDITVPSSVEKTGSNALKDIAVYGKGEKARFEDAVKKAADYFKGLSVKTESRDMLLESLKSVIGDFDADITDFERTESKLSAAADIYVNKDGRKFVYTVSGSRMIPTHDLTAIVKKINTAVKAMNINNATDSDDLMKVVNTAVNDERVEIVYVQDFGKVRAVNGAKIFLSGAQVGNIPAYNGRITAVLGVKFKGEKTTVIVDEAVRATVENYNYTSKAPDSAFTVENGALKKYSGNYGLVVIPSSVTKIDALAFQNANVQAVVIPDTVTNIDWSTFYDCKKLEAAVISDKVGKLPGMNFRGCTALKYVKLPSGLTQIGEECFRNTEKLETIKINNSLVYLDRRAFVNSGIYEITLPSSLEVIYDSAFRAEAGSVRNLDKVTVLSDSVKYDAGKNINEPKGTADRLPIFGYGHKVDLYCRPGSSTAKLYKSMKMTDEYKGLELCEYEDQTYLDAVYAAKKIVENMYSDTETAKLLKEFISKKINNKNVTVDVADFSYNRVNISALVNIGIKVGGEKWILTLSGRKKVIVSGYEQLMSAAQKAVNTMAVSNSTTENDVENAIRTAIDSGTAVIKWSSDFAKRKSVHGAVIKVKSEQWDIPGTEGKITGYINITFKGKNKNIKLEKTIMPAVETLKYNTISNESDFTIVNDKVFEYNGDAEVVVVPKAETVVTECFKQRSGIKALIIPEGMKVLQSQALQYMEDLEAVYLPDSCTNLGISETRPDNEGAAMFTHDHKLKYVRLSPYTAEIPFYTFSNCRSLTEFYIPEGITKIGHRAFWRVENMEDLVLPSTLTKIGSYAFAGNNAIGIVAFESISVLSSDLEYYKETDQYPHAGPFCCYTNKEVQFYYPEGAKANYIDKTNQEFNFKINTHGVKQSLSQAAIDAQRLLNDYPIVNETAKKDIDAAISKLLTNKKLTYKWTENYSLKNCTAEQDGIATGKIILTDKDSGLSFNLTLNKKISAATFEDNRTITIYAPDPEDIDGDDDWDDDDWDDDDDWTDDDGETAKKGSSSVKSGKIKTTLYIGLGAAALVVLTGVSVLVVLFVKKRKKAL